MVIYRNRQLKIYDKYAMVKIYVQWFKEENNRIKQRKIYSTCMNQFIKLVKSEGEYLSNYNSSEAFDIIWERNIKQVFYGKYTDSKEVVNEWGIE